MVSTGGWRVSTGTGVDKAVGDGVLSGSPEASTVSVASLPAKPLSGV